jgi:UDP-N-acetylglucosamine diphosphorylase / glucose-1-phosphate thymidylyltransferase / UDP-N-acetylgalactosamine diphosphorylase / glucosamine-1-phosphate N-acetyltransferase / galactosamine-1-phosphate N-acetyltransferase
LQFGIRTIFFNLTYQLIVMIDINEYVSEWEVIFPSLNIPPWQLTGKLQELINARINALGPEFSVKNNVAIHRDARIEEHVILKGPIIISSGCFVGAHAYLRGGVFLGVSASIGPGCEIKSSVIMPQGALAHFNFVGDSILGSRINLEAGAVIANHYNERSDKTIIVQVSGSRFNTNVTKFGALVGDDAKIGANAVLSPGTVLSPASIVGRLALVNQNP